MKIDDTTRHVMRSAMLRSLWILPSYALILIAIFGYFTDMSLVDIVRYASAGLAYYHIWFICTINIGNTVCDVIRCILDVVFICLILFVFRTASIKAILGIFGFNLILDKFLYFGLLELIDSCWTIFRWTIIDTIKGTLKKKEC